MDPELDDQVMTPRRALRTARIRSVHLVADDGVDRRVVTKASALQAEILSAFGAQQHEHRARPAAATVGVFTHRCCREGEV